jgi:hypothetical protein
MGKLKDDFYYHSNGKVHINRRKTDGNYRDRSDLKLFPTIMHEARSTDDLKEQPKYERVNYRVALFKSKDGKYYTQTQDSYDDCYEITDKEFVEYVTGWRWTS